jgi:predicted transcriptional regulator
VKGYLHGEQVIAMQKINHLAEYNGKNYWLMLDGLECGEKGEIELDSYRSHWEKYTQPVTLEECRECIANYFVPSSMCIVLVGSSLPSSKVLEKCVDSYFD